MKIQNILKIIVFAFFSFGFFFAITWGRTHTSEAKIIELTWTRRIAIQKCVRAEGDRFLLSAVGFESRPCRWIWNGTIASDGTNTIPYWPNITIDEETRIVERRELYYAKLDPVSLVGNWHYYGSDENIYNTFLNVFDSNSTICVLTSFDLVERMCP